MSTPVTLFMEACGIAYRHRPGNGQDVIMLHGIGSDASSFDRLLGHLPADWNVVAWNAPGYGGSKPLADPAPDARDYAVRLMEFVEALGIGSMILVGHSLGTLVAAEFTFSHPDRVHGLILMACAQGYGMNKGDALPAKAADRLDALARLGPLEFATQRAPRLMAHPETQPDILADAIDAMSRIERAGYGQAVHALSCGDLVQSAARIAVPSLVLVGLEDKITPPDQSRKTHAALSDCAPDHAHDWAEIENAGHIVHQQRPKTVAAAFSGFVERLRPELERARS